ncbi:MAG: XdhC family protein [Bacteroidetes bacterium]|nr:XdhC family protein [Bacteroidota bacterium]
MHQLSLWKFIVQKLTFHHPVILLCVVESNGSSPGRQGFKMAVSENEMVGSIGGGIMEHKFVELAKERLQQGSSASFIRKQFHQKSAAKDQSGMICSGEQTVLLYLLAEKDLPVIHRIVSALENNNTGLLKITFSEFEFVDSNYQEDDHGFNMRSETDFTYTERIGFKNHLYIIGGGHCASALSELMSGMGFYIHLFEERENLNTMIENNFVHEKIMVNDYSELAALIPDGNSHPAGRAAPAGWDRYLAVMTFGYRTDDIAVRALADKKLRYLGVLGSESKMKQLFNDWRKDGISESWLSTIHAPIGIRIKSETPEEIAVSIAAQIINIKNA